MITQLQLPVGAKIMPDFMLSIEDKALERSIAERVMSLKVTDNSGFSADSLEVTFDDSDSALEMPLRGAVLHLHLGWKGKPLIDCGRFVVDTVKHIGAPDKLTIVARSADFRGSFNTKGSYSYDDYTLGAIVGIISRRNKLLPANLSPEMAAIKVSHIDQTDETDAFFLMRLAQLYGAQASVKQGAIIFIKSGYAVTGSGKSLPWMTINRSDGDSHNFEIADKHSYSGVKAKWHDAKKAQAAQSGIQRTSGTTNAATTPHPNAKSASTPPAKTSSDEQNYMVGSPENVLVLSKIYPDKDTATRAADAIFKQVQIGLASFSIKLALGRADLSPQTPVVVRGFKQIIDQQRWIIDSVVHDVNGSGFVTTLNLKLYIDDVAYQHSEPQN